jgi:hypothetical protein
MSSSEVVALMMFGMGSSHNQLCYGIENIVMFEALASLQHGNQGTQHKNSALH